MICWARSFSLELKMTAVSQPELCLFKMAEKKNKIKIKIKKMSSLRRKHKLTVIELVQNSSRFQEDNWTGYKASSTKFKNDYWNSHFTAWCPKYCPLHSFMVSKTGSLHNLNKCTLKVKVKKKKYIYIVIMFQFNSGFSSWKIAE